jgi:DNA-binding GntR family transcriptional regulator
LMPPKAPQFILSSALRRDYEMMRLAARQARDSQLLEDLQDSAGWSLPSDSHDYLVGILGRHGVVTDAGGGQVASSVVHMAMTDLVPVAPALGRVTIRELLHRVVPATPIVQDRLGADNDEVLLVEQLVSLGTEPLFHAVGYSPADTADHVSATIRGLSRHPGELDMAELFQSLFGVALGRVAVGVGAVRADLRTARLLKVETGTGILVREFLQYDAAGRPRSYNFTQFRPDRVRFVARHPAAQLTRYGLRRDR